MNSLRAPDLIVTYYGAPKSELSVDTNSSKFGYGSGGQGMAPVRVRLRAIRGQRADAPHSLMRDSDRKLAKKVAFSLRPRRRPVNIGLGVDPVPAGRGRGAGGHFFSTGTRARRKPKL